MIPLTAEHYAAIGKIAVHSGILERELSQYIANLAPQAKLPYGLRPKLQNLRERLTAATASQAGLRDLERLLDKILDLVLQRNSVVHGVWEADSMTPKIHAESIAIGEVRVRAREAASVAHSLRNARMLLLHLLIDHCASAAAGRDRPKSDPARLRIQLQL
jgi:uncharacterized protein YigA (DUF484 family)